MLIRKAVIPVAGAGTRLLPATKAQPKEMLLVGRKPVVQYVVDELIQQGLKQILFVTGREKRSIEDYFDTDAELLEKLSESEKVDDELLRGLDYERFGIDFFYIRQTTPRGLGDAIGTAENFIDQEPFVVALGDTIIVGKDGSDLIRRMAGLYQRTKASCILAVEEVAEEDIPKYGIVKPKGQVGQEFEIEDLIEKPTIEEAPSNLAIAARYIFEPNIFDAIRRTVPKPGGELELSDAIQVLLKQGHQVWCLCLKEDEKRYDIGNYESYFKAFIDFAMEDAKYGYLIRQYLRKKFL